MKFLKIFFVTCFFVINSYPVESVFQINVRNHLSGELEWQSFKFEHKKQYSNSNEEVEHRNNFSNKCKSKCYCISKTNRSHLAYTILFFIFHRITAKASSNPTLHLSASIMPNTMKENKHTTWLLTHFLTLHTKSLCTNTIHIEHRSSEKTQIMITEQMTNLLHPPKMKSNKTRSMMKPGFTVIL